MSILQRQVIQSLNGLSEDNLRFLLDMIQRFMKPAEAGDENRNRFATGNKKNIRRIGSLEGQRLIAPDYDIDACNDEIEKMFEVFGE